MNKITYLKKITLKEHCNAQLKSTKLSLLSSLYMDKSSVIPKLASSRILTLYPLHTVASGQATSKKDTNIPYRPRGHRYGACCSLTGKRISVGMD